MNPLSNPYRSHSIQRRAFTLVELIVVIAIIALLIAILLPVLQGARQSARTTACASNMRQIMVGLVNYANDYRGKFPGNRGSDYSFWYDSNRLGKYIKGCTTLSDGTLADGVLVCPSDNDGGRRSYSMNVWASGYVSDFVDFSQGKLFDFATKQGSRMIVLGEAFWEDPSINRAHVPASPAIIGGYGTPGQRFGADGGVGMAMIYGQDVYSQLTYARHRHGRENSLNQLAPRGSLNIGFADGHVQLLRAEQLVSFESGLSRYEALWSEMDPTLEP